jgi:hypothetical protein
VGELTPGGKSETLNGCKGKPLGLPPEQDRWETSTLDAGVDP